MVSSFADIKNAGWGINQDTWDTLSPYEQSFATIELTGQRTFDYYHKRLQMIGFQNMNKVLDAACGMGQWAMVLAEMNKTVLGVDTNHTRIKVAQQLAASMDYHNTLFDTGSIECVAQPDASVDGIFCYGAFMFTHTQRTLREFHRLLKPGGKVYLNVNSYGWLMHLMLDRIVRSGDFSAFKGTFRMLGNSLLGKKKNVFFTHSQIRELFQKEGFEIIESGIEGTIDVNDPKPKHYSTYPAKYYGLPSILEVLAVKSA